MVKLGRIKIGITIREELAKEIEDFYRQLIMEALRSKEKIPKLSHLYEEIIEMGWEAKKASKQAKV